MTSFSNRKRLPRFTITKNLALFSFIGQKLNLSQILTGSSFNFYKIIIYWNFEYFFVVIIGRNRIYLRIRFRRLGITTLFSQFLFLVIISSSNNITIWHLISYLNAFDLLVCIGNFDCMNFLKRSLFGIKCFLIIKNKTFIFLIISERYTHFGLVSLNIIKFTFNHIRIFFICLIFDKVRFVIRRNIAFSIWH